MEIKTYNKIYEDMQNYIIANQDKLTDFNKGGVLTSQIEAIAREINMLYVSCRVGFSTFLRSLPYSVFGFKMKEGIKATVDVVFTRKKALSSDTNIPSGTIVAAGGLKFITSRAGVIANGDIDSLPIPAIAQEAGDKYNTPANTINIIESVLPNEIASVNNPAEATGGVNDEDWASYTDRFADYIIGLQRTNSLGLISGISELCRSASVVEHFPPLDDIWNLTMYLEDGSGSMSPSDLAEVKKIIDGDFANGIGGYRAPGINIEYKSPEAVPISLNIMVTRDRVVAYGKENNEIKKMVESEVRTSINNKKIGESVLRSDINLILRRLSYISNVQIIDPEDDIEIRQDQIARFHECEITVLGE